MPAATYTEASFADNITVVITRIRTGPSTMDWSAIVTAQAIDSQGNILKSISADLATLISGANLTTLKGFLTIAVSTAATNRSITTNL